MVSVTASVTSFAGQGTTDLRSLTFNNTSSSAGLILYSSPVSGSTVTYTISVKSADSDRSVGNNGLQVFGTITKTAVASGADLVAYSGFSDNTNYFQQPYSSDLDFGTGDFSVQLWHNHAGAFNDTTYFAARVDGGVGNAWQVGAADSDSSYLWVINGVICARTSSYAINTSSWSHLVYVRRNGITEIWVNGVQKATSTNSSSALNVDYSNSSLQVPVKTACGDGADNIALLRISATAPTAADIKKDYEDEKVLFQENAKAVLAGTSDEITALAYDDSHDELLAGTSQYTSVFRGLRRVEAIAGSATAISASNGLRVIED